MVTPAATSQTSFLEKAAGLTLLLRHAFPQVRLPSRSGKTKPRASGTNPFQAVPKIRPLIRSRHPGNAVTAGAPGFYQRPPPLSISHAAES
jgi:hypothetical protein